MICIIDYQAGNLRSVKRALDYLGVESIISNDLNVIKESDKLIFPGVGAAGEAMKVLKDLKLDDAIKEAYQQNKIILGICLGTQIILESSDENNTKTLGLIEGQCKKFSLPEQFTIPHIGWNQVNYQQTHPFFTDIPTATNFYFVHSYYPSVSKEITLASSEYGGQNFASVLFSKNLISTQFHPEKSGKYGLKLLENFANWKGVC